MTEGVITTRELEKGKANRVHEFVIFICIRVLTNVRIVKIDVGGHYVGIILMPKDIEIGDRPEIMVFPLSACVGYWSFR